LNHGAPVVDPVQWQQPEASMLPRDFGLAELAWGDPRLHGAAGASSM
jgi:hypothetical protein